MNTFQTRVVQFTAMALVLFITPRAIAAEDSNFSKLKNAIECAENLELASSKTWLALLHYVSNSKSEITDNNFFISSFGQHDAAAELNANLTALIVESQNKRNKFCKRFPARTLWLKQMLKEHLPPINVDIPKYKCAYLMFAAGYMNSAPSMAGHVFVAFEGEQSRGASRSCFQFAGLESADGLNSTEALSSIWGGLEGSYIKTNYSDLTKGYRHLEHRDIWEYSLNLTSNEVELLAAHTIELDGIRGSFSFFKNNCARKLANFLNVAKPNLCFLNGQPFVISPLSLIRHTYELGLASKYILKPARLNNLRQRMQKLDKTARSLCITLTAPGPAPSKSKTAAQLAKLTKSKNLLVIEAAILRLGIMFNDGRISVEEYSKRLDTILALADDSALLFKSITPPRTGPHMAHKSGVIGYGIMLNNGTPALKIRGWMHGLLENNIGYSSNSEVVMLEAIMRFEDDSEILLDEFTLLRMRSLIPTSDYSSNLSWCLELGLTKNSHLPQTAPSAWMLKFGLGKTRFIFDIPIYTMFNFGGQYIESTRGGRAQTEIEIGTVLGTPFPAHIFAKHILDSAAPDGQYSLAGAKINIPIRTGCNLELEGTTALLDTEDVHHAKCMLSFHW